MEPVTIRPPERSVYRTIFHSAVLLFGVFILGYLMVEYLTSSLPSNWWTNLVIGLGLIVSQLYVFVSRPPEFRIDDTGIDVERISNTWYTTDTSFKWADLKAVWFEKKEVRIQYRTSGAQHRLRLPKGIAEKRDQIDQKPREATTSHDVAFNPE